MAPPGFCNRGRSEVRVYRGSRVRNPPVPVVLSVYQRGSLLDGLAMYLSCDTKKFHDNESTHTLHNFWTSTHREEASLFPLAAPLVSGYKNSGHAIPVSKWALCGPRTQISVEPTRWRMQLILFHEMWYTRVHEFRKSDLRWHWVPYYITTILFNHRQRLLSGQQTEFRLIGLRDLIGVVK